MSWKKVRLADIASMKTGKLDSNAAVADGDYPFFTCSQQTLRIDKPAYDTKAVLLGGNNAAGVFPLKYYEGQFNAYQRTYIIESLDPNELNIRFLFYSLRPALTHFQTVSIGAATQYLTKGILDNFQVALPSLDEQDRITSTLSPYDDLIENNRRRIQLLEAAARLLYKEWFVHLRFPGHEHVKITHGVPEGWKRTTLESSCIPKNGIQTGPFGSQLHQHDYVEDGHPVVMPKDIIGARINTSTIARVPDSIRERLSRHILEPGDIVLARRGDIGRKAFVTEREAGWMCGTGCMRLRPNPTNVFPRFFLHTLGRRDVMGVIAGRAQGAIMPNLNLSILADVALTLPPLTLQRLFDELVSATDRLAQLLDEQNERLRRARDLLLPRLMNGEIGV